MEGERGLERCTCQGRFAKEVTRGGRVLENREMGERGGDWVGERANLIWGRGGRGQGLGDKWKIGRWIEEV